MPRTAWVFLVALISLTTTQSPSVPAAGTVDTKLRVSAKVVGQTYCKAYPDEFSVFIKLRLRFTNTSNAPLILARHIPTVSRVRVSVSAEDAQQGRYVYKPSVDRVGASPKSFQFGIKPDQRYFVVLRPGEEYEATAWSNVVANLSTRQKSNSTLTAGTYVMQLFVDTMPPLFRSDSQVDEVAAKWKKFGELFTSTVPTADFVPLELPLNPKAKNCGESR